MIWNMPCDMVCFMALAKLCLEYISYLGFSNNVFYFGDGNNELGSISTLNFIAIGLAIVLVCLCFLDGKMCCAKLNDNVHSMYKSPSVSSIQYTQYTHSLCLAQFILLYSHCVNTVVMNGNINMWTWHACQMWQKFWYWISQFNFLGYKNANICLEVVFKLIIVLQKVLRGKVWIEYEHSSYSWHFLESMEVWCAPLVCGVQCHLQPRCVIVWYVGMVVLCGCNDFSDNLSCFPDQ